MVVGAGMAGASVAAELSERLSVVVVRVRVRQSVSQPGLTMRYS